MMKRLSTLEAPALAGVVREKTARAAQAEIKNCHLHGAAMIDLHLSCLEDRSEENLRAIIEKSPLPVLALNYAGAYDWTPIPFTEQERAELFLSAVRAGAAGVDFALATWGTSDMGIAAAYKPQSLLALLEMIR